jgi:CheY-like chemotaxis protein
VTSTAAPPTPLRVAVVDDDRDRLRLLALSFEVHGGGAVVAAAAPVTGLEVADHDPEVVLVVDGADVPDRAATLLPRLRQRLPDAMLGLIVVGDPADPTAVRAARGADVVYRADEVGVAFPVRVLTDHDAHRGRPAVHLASAS